MGSKRYKREICFRRIYYLGGHFRSQILRFGCERGRCFVYSLYSYGAHSNVWRNAKWRMGRFRMFLGAIYALRRTLGLQRSLFYTAFAEADRFVRKSARSPHSPKARIVGFTDIGLHGTGGGIPPTLQRYCDISITLAISDIQPKLVNNTTLTWTQAQRPAQLFINMSEPVNFANSMIHRIKGCG